jgi:glycosyltransferase involved in cell wall biosynthesis
LLIDALDSCRRQENVQVQIIVVDDASTDDTMSVLSAYGNDISVLQHETNQGAPAARNTGLAHAAGRYVKFLDSDDILMPNTLAAEVAAGDEHAADIVTGGLIYYEIDRGGNMIPGTEIRTPPPIMESPIDDVLHGKAVPTSAALYKKSFAAKLKWDPNLKRLQDWDWFVQAVLKGGRIVHVAHTSYAMRRHAESRISDASILTTAYAHRMILKKIEAYLFQNDLMNEARSRRLAQYNYKYIRIFAAHDKHAYKSALRHIRELDPDFFPYTERNPRIRMMMRFIGVTPTLFLYRLAAGLRKGLRKHK